MFNASAINLLLDDALDSTQLISNLLAIDKNDDNYIKLPSVSPLINNLVNQNNGQTVDYSRVYSQLLKLILNRNIALQVLQAVDPDVSGSEVATSTAALMNAVKNCISEFTKIHLQHIKYQQNINLLKIKHKLKMELLEKKKQIFLARNNNNPNENIIDIKLNTNGNTMIPWQSLGISNYMKYLKEQQKNG